VSKYTKIFDRMLVRHYEQRRSEPCCSPQRNEKTKKKQTHPAIATERTFPSAVNSVTLKMPSPAPSKAYATRLHGRSGWRGKERKRNNLQATTQHQQQTSQTRPNFAPSAPAPNEAITSVKPTSFNQNEKKKKKKKKKKSTNHTKRQQAVSKKTLVRFCPRNSSQNSIVEGRSNSGEEENRQQQQRSFFQEKAQRIQGRKPIVFAWLRE
jgi:hypothetical protein